MRRNLNAAIRLLALSKIKPVKHARERRAVDCENASAVSLNPDFPC